MQEGERCTAFFSSIRKTGQNKTYIREVEDKSGQTPNRTEDILQEVHNYYKDLISKQGIDSRASQIALDAAKRMMIEPGVILT